MVGENLRDELLSVVGVASAEVDAEGDAPSGVRVRLLPDADPDAVGAEVQRVLAAHGMRSRIASEASQAEQPESPRSPAAPPPVADVPAPTVPPSGPERVAEAAAARFAPPSDERAAGDLASLAFEESADGVTVTAVSTDDRRSSRHAAAITDDAIAEAVVAAVSSLAEGAPPRLLWISGETIEGTHVVTVLVERSDGTRLAGAAVVRAARAYAVARATWMALRG